jgi:toxin YhaV
MKGRDAPKKGAGTPLEINGWKIYVWSEFRDRWTALRHRVEALRQTDPDGYRSRPETKFFAAVRALILTEIPADPAAPHFRQGKTMGSSNLHWRRAKFMRRFRLFFRYHTTSKTIIYVWLNDEHTLRKAGASSDVYRVFAGMLSRGKPPTDWDALVEACERWPAIDAEVPPVP